MSLATRRIWILSVIKRSLVAGMGWVALVGCSVDSQPSFVPPLAMENQPETDPVPKPAEPTAQPTAQPSVEPATGRSELATFGAGCFWCVEAVFQQLEGVTKVESGYSGGHVDNPTYREICNGDTGHAEVCQLTFDPAKISFAELLQVFWQTHDPTTPNQQGHDIGPQYRSVVFYHSDAQRELAEKYKKELNEAQVFSRPVVTEITKFTRFYQAEEYHQNYYRDNPSEGYCRLVIQPKLDKFKRVFADKLKTGK